MDFLKKEVTEKSKKLDRIDVTISKINFYWSSPFIIDAINQRVGYEIIFSLLETLSLEVSFSLTNTEIDADKQHREKIKKLIKEKPVFEFRFNDTLKGRTKRIIRHNENWEEIKECLLDYDRDLRKWIAKHFEKQIYIEGQEDSATAIIEEDEEY